MQPVEIKEDKNLYCGFNLNFNADDASFRNLLELKKYPGYILKDDSIEEWRFTGILHKENLYLYGPHFEGTSLSEVISLNSEEGLNYIYRLVSALNELENKRGVAIPIQLDAIYFLKDGSILFLPYKVMELLRESLDEEYKIGNYFIVNHPYITEDRIQNSYSIGVILYRILSGEFPFSGKTEEELNKKIRIGNVLQPVLNNFYLNNEISDNLLFFFMEKKWTSVSISEWFEIIGNYIKEGVIRKIDNVEEKDLMKLQGKYRKRLDHIYGRSVFLEKNRLNIIIISIVLAVVILLVFSFKKIIFNIRITKGFISSKVVELFYESMNNLDSPAMQDCVINNAGKKEIDEVSTLYVITKQSAAYGEKNYFSAEKWAADGKNKLMPPLYIYGITDLIISNEIENSSNAIYSVYYQKWEPVFGENKKIELDYHGFNENDKLFLIKKHGYWLITKIDRIEKIPLK